MLIYFKSLKDIYTKYKIVFNLIISSIFFMISTLWTSFTAFNVAFLSVIFFYSPIDEILYYLIFFMMFSRSTIFFVLIAITAFLSIMAKFINAIASKKIVIAKIPLIVTTIICFVFGLINYSFKFEGICLGFLVVALLYLGYFLFCYRKEININKMFLFLFAGILASAIVSFILYFIPKAEIIFYDTDGFYIRSVRNLIFIKDPGFNRLTLLTYHPNHLNCYCTFIICYVVYQILNKNNLSIKEITVYVFIFIVCLIIGVLTISKAFIICTVLSVSYSLLFLLIKFKKQSWKYIIPIILIIITICLCFYDKILTIFGRFLNEESNSVASSITTGRTDIWKQYFEQIFSSPLKMLFGHGIFATEVVPIGAHNMYIAVLYRFGIVGTLSLVGLLGTYYLECKDMHISLYRCLPICMYLFYSLQEVSIDERFVFLILSIMLLFQKNDDNILNKEDDTDKDSTDDIIKSE